MEDSVTDVKSMLPPLNLSPEDGSRREELDDEANKEDGFVSEGKLEEEKEENLGKDEHTGKDSVAKDEAKEGGGGGLINNLFSALVTPLSTRTGKTIEHESGNGVFKSEKIGGDDENRGEGEGGLISNLVSNFLHKSEPQGVAVENEKGKECDDDEEDEGIVDEKIKRVKTEKDTYGGGRGIIHNIVSHLPASLPDDAVPSADEATFLINSLVRD